MRGKEFRTISHHRDSHQHQRISIPTAPHHPFRGRPFLFGPASSPPRGRGLLLNRKTNRRVPPYQVFIILCHDRKKAMSLLRDASRPLRHLRRVNAVQRAVARPCRRSLSSEVERLPLSGIRVLDMTRVLAGVSGIHCVFGRRVY